MLPAINLISKKYRAVKLTCHYGQAAARKLEFGIVDGHVERRAVLEVGKLWSCVTVLVSLGTHASHITALTASLLTSSPRSPSQLFDED